MKTNSTTKKYSKRNQLEPVLLKNTAKVIGSIAIFGVIGAGVLHFTGMSLKGAVNFLRTKASISAGVNPVESSTNETLDHYRASYKAFTLSATSGAIVGEDGKAVQTLDIESGKDFSLNRKVIEHYEKAPINSSVLINETLTTGSSTTKDGETKVKVTVSADEQGKVTTTIEELSLGKDAKNNNTITDVVTTKITADTNIKDLNPTSDSQKFMFSFAKKTAAELSNASKDGETQMALQTVSSALLANWGNLSSKEQEALGADNTSVEIASVKRSSSVTIGADAHYKNGYAIFDGAINYNVVDKKTGKDLVLISGKFAIDQNGNYAGSALGVSGRITRNVVGYFSANHNLVEGFSGSAGFRISFGKDDNTPSLIEVGLTPNIRTDENENSPSQPHPSDRIEYESSIPGFVNTQRNDNTNIESGNNTSNNNSNSSTNNQSHNNNQPTQTPSNQGGLPFNGQGSDNLSLN